MTISRTPLSSLAQLGSQLWLEQVFAAPPVGVETILKRKHLHRNAPRFEGRAHYFNGSLALLAAYVLDYYRRRGIVRRWKEYPFVWSIDSAHFAGQPPHFLFETADGERAVVRIKATRYLTTEIQRAIDWEANEVRTAGMTHLWWNEVRPLSRTCQALHVGLRAGQCASYDEKAMAELVDAVQRAGQLSARELIDMDLDTTLLPAAVAHGRLYTDMTEAIHERSVFCTQPLTDLRRVLMGSGFDSLRWWNSLPSGGGRPEERRVDAGALGQP